MAFPFLYGLDARTTAETLGAYIETSSDPPYVQATAFVLTPTGTVDLAVYSSANVGRLRAVEALSRIEPRGAPSGRESVIRRNSEEAIVHLTAILSTQMEKRRSQRSGS